MTDPRSPLASLIFRPARPPDRPQVRLLLQQFKQEVVPPIPLSWILWNTGLLGVGLVVSLGLTNWIGLDELLNLLAGPAIVIGLGLLATLLITWNEDWAHFWLIEYQGETIACAKLRQYGQYSALYDVYVLAPWRQRGVGSYLISQLSAQASKPLYLACLPGRVAFYRRLGFMPILPKQIPPLLQYELGVVGRQGIVAMMLTQ